MTILSYSCLAMEFPEKISDEEAAALLKAPKNIIEKVFFTAVEKSNIPLVERFLQAREGLVRIGKYTKCEVFNDNTRVFSEYKTPLDIAAENGDLAVAQLLVQAGDDPNYAFPSYRMDSVAPLMVAVRHNDIRAIRVLLQVGADPDFFGSLLSKIVIEEKSRYCQKKSCFMDSNNALTMAAITDKYDVVEMLVEGVKYPPNLLTNLIVELQQQKMKTYFSLLSLELLTEFVPYLNQHFTIQADPNIKTLQGLTPLDLIFPDPHIPISVENKARLYKVVALLRSKKGAKMEKPAITLKELYNLPTHKS